MRTSLVEMFLGHVVLMCKSDQNKQAAFTFGMLTAQLRADGFSLPANTEKKKDCYSGNGHISSGRTDTLPSFLLMDLEKQNWSFYGLFFQLREIIFLFGEQKINKSRALLLSTRTDPNIKSHPVHIGLLSGPQNCFPAPIRSCLWAP